jgi:Protein of unknown function (DUF1501)
MFSQPAIPLIDATSTGPTRRRLLQLGGLGALGLFWSDWARAEASVTGRRPGSAKSVILIFNCGAPSHVDLWDMKPDAPDTIRGQFQPIATRVPGIRISELMPRLAQRADKLAVVRTLHHTHGGHNSGMYWSIVGRPYRMDSTLINPTRTDYPSFGTLVGWLARRDGYSGALPPYVITPAPHCDSTVYITPGQYGGCLGARFDPLVLNADPNAANFRVPNLGLAAELTGRRLSERQGLLGRLNARSGATVAAGHDLDINRGTATELITSRGVQRAFDLSQEPVSIRERYGRHSWGQSHLLARRLIESGVRFVTTVNGPSIIWDTHQDNFNRLKNRLVPPMEQAFTALLDDLEGRGLLDETLVVWMGDFGRTPIINAQVGRDHWPRCYSMVLAGGGIRGGQVYGESDRTGSAPKSFPVTPADIHATVFTALGYDPHAITYVSPEGRPFPLSEGQAIRQLL